MKVGDSVRLAIDDWERSEFESAMLHACNAVDGTARKRFPNLASNRRRFTSLLREYYWLLGPMGAPGINLVETRFPVSIQKPTASDGRPDLADVVYSIHRCSHGHGDELPDGFDLNLDAGGPPRYTRIAIQKGKLKLSDRVIFGLLAVAVLSPENVKQRVPNGYVLTFAGNSFEIGDWWGRAKDFAAVVEKEPLPSVKLDFGDWMDE